MQRIFRAIAARVVCLGDREVVVGYDEVTATDVLQTDVVVATFAGNELLVSFEDDFGAITVVSPAIRAP